MLPRSKTMFKKLSDVLIKFKVILVCYCRMYFMMSQFMHVFVPKKIPVNNLGLIFHVIHRPIPIAERWEARDFTPKST